MRMYTGAFRQQQPSVSSINSLSPEAQALTFQVFLAQIKLLNSRLTFRFAEAKTWRVLKQFDVFWTFALSICASDD